MARRSRSSDGDFPALTSAGLYAARIRGDGNCLFNALSDQIYGTQDRHVEVRKAVIKYMRNNAEDFKPFLDVNPGGGVRRNPKRKNAGGFSGGLARAPSEEDVDKTWEEHLARMAKGGTWGDHLEIHAFAAAYECDVKIWQEGVTLVSSSGEAKQTVHLAYHQWEHYSSVRNIDGPHDGPPEVHDETRRRGSLKPDPIERWHIKAVSSSLPFFVERDTVEQTLREANLDIDAAVSKLIEENRGSPCSSTQGSSSVERDVNSDDEDFQAPTKKQDRRLSRATRSMIDRRYRMNFTESPLENGSQSSLASHQDRSSPALSDTGSFRPEVRGSDSQAESSFGATETGTAESTELLPSGKIQKPNLGQQRTRLAARDRKDIKKQAQKQAQKANRRAKAQGQTSTSKALPILTKMSEANNSTPMLQNGVRTLYI